MPKSSTICVDANLVVRFVVDPNDETIAQLWRQWRDDGQRFVAPTLLRYEVTNALHRLAHAGLASVHAVRETLRDALDLPIRLHSEGELHHGALDFAARFNLPAAYDAHYLALAERLGAEFWTADERLFRAVQHDLAWVRLAA